jgi:uncharacterized membrane protein
MISTFLLYKWIHILSSVLLVGTGFGSAFYMYFTLRTRHVPSIATVSRLVVNADWWFTTPAGIVQPITGYLMVRTVGYSFEAAWLQYSVVLYVLAGVCWLPVVWLQLRMRDMAVKAVSDQAALPPQFWRYARYWEWLGYPAFVAMMVIYWLMVFRPS